MNFLYPWSESILDRVPTTFPSILKSNELWLKENVAPGSIATWGHTSTQVPLAKHSDITPGVYEWQVLQFGMNNSPCCAIYSHVRVNGEDGKWAVEAASMSTIVW